MSGLLLVLGLAVAGGAGSVCRVLVDGAVRRRRPGPLGIVAVNVTGSFALGILTGWLTGWAPTALVVAGTGFLGAYTTFSTAMIDAVTLLREPRRSGGARLARAAALLLVPIVLSIPAAALGLLAGTAL